MRAHSVLLVLYFSLGVNGLSPRAVGGNEAPIGKYPYQVSIRYYNGHFCGGSIINKRYILTAAHCLKSLVYLHRISIHAGTNFLNETGDVYKVESFEYHEGYSRLLLKNDIGVLRVTEDMKFTHLVQPIKLATTDSSFEGQSCLVAGWGFTQVNGKSSNNLKELNVFIKSLTKCKKAFVWVTDSQICTYQKHGEGVCEGDSGSPLVADGVQIGIVSFSVPCAVGYPDVYAKVATHQNWIKQHTQSV